MAKTVVATAPNGSTRVFKNIQKAAEYLTSSVEPGASVSKYRAILAGLFESQREMAGYTWSKDSGRVVQEEVVEAVMGEEVVEVPENIAGSSEYENDEGPILTLGHYHKNPDSESFFELVDSIFRGDSVRLCCINNVKMVSVYDVLSIISERPNQVWTSYKRICDENPEVKEYQYTYQFLGQGQRPTPVVDAQGFHLIAMAASGVRARQFRMKAADVLHKVLEGNLDDLQGSAPAYEEALGHSNSLYRLARPSAGRHDGESLSNFTGACVYILTIKVDDKDMLKIGRSDDFNARIAQHDKVFDVQKVYSITPCDKSWKLEKVAKERLCYYNHPVEIGGKRYLELYRGVTPEEADRVVHECARELELGDDRSFQMRMTEFGLEMKRMDFQVKEREQEIEKMKLKIEMFKLGMSP